MVLDAYIGFMSEVFGTRRRMATLMQLSGDYKLAISTVGGDSENTISFTDHMGLLTHWNMRVGE